MSSNMAKALLFSIVLMLLVSMNKQLPLSQGKSCNVRPVSPILHDIYWYVYDLDFNNTVPHVFIEDQTANNIGEVLDKIKSVKRSDKIVSRLVEDDPENVTPKTCDILFAPVQAKKLPSDIGFMLRFDPPEKDLLKIGVFVNNHPEPRLLKWQRHGVNLSTIYHKDCELIHAQNIYNCSITIKNPTKNDLECDYMLLVEYEWESIPILFKLAPTGLANEVFSSSYGWLLILVALFALIIGAIIGIVLSHYWNKVRSWCSKSGASPSSGGQEDPHDTEGTALTTVKNINEVQVEQTKKISKLGSIQQSEA